MLLLQYKNEKVRHTISFKTITRNIIQITGDFPVKTKGFELSRLPEDIAGKKDNEDFWEGWNYLDYTTVYREVEGGVQFSNNGSVYIPPAPKPEPEPYVPTLEEVKAQKLSEIVYMQQATIENGISVTLSNETVEYFSLSEKNQRFLTALSKEVESGNDKIPFHTASGDCKYFSNADMVLIINAAQNFMTYQETYLSSLTKYVESLEDKESIGNVVYGMYVPKDYQSEVLTDMYAALGVTEENALPTIPEESDIEQEEQEEVEDR